MVAYTTHGHPVKNNQRNKRDEEERTESITSRGPLLRVISHRPLLVGDSLFPDYALFCTGYFRVAFPVRFTFVRQFDSAGSLSTSSNKTGSLSIEEAILLASSKTILPPSGPRSTPQKVAIPSATSPTAADSEAATDSRTPPQVHESDDQPSKVNPRTQTDATGFFSNLLGKKVETKPLKIRKVYLNAGSKKRKSAGDGERSEDGNKPDNGKKTKSEADKHGSPDDVSEPPNKKAKVIRKGLKNMDTNFCYLNSALQLLARPFSHGYGSRLDRLDGDDKLTPTLPLNRCEKFKNLHHRLRDNSETDVSDPRSYAESYAAFTASVLESQSTAKGNLFTGNSKILRILSFANSRNLRSRRGRLWRWTKVAPVRSTRTRLLLWSRTTEPHWILPCPSIEHRDPTIEQYVKKAFGDEEIERTCRKCGNHGVMVEMRRLKKAPRYMMVNPTPSIRSSRRMQAIVPKDISLQPEITLDVESGSSVTYVMEGFIKHKGETIDRGHYRAMVKEDKEWVECDDQWATVMLDEDQAMGLDDGEVPNVILFRRAD
ncbi:MAG: hypothetical protein MMC33_009263 [Icmadophila ericetorum]|nr:hypothetical protein [Icmadophila ericetorum]